MKRRNVETSKRRNEATKARRQGGSGDQGGSLNERRRGRIAGYVLLETVIATGLLLAGLAVIGAQIQDGSRAIRSMNQRLRALALAETQLAEMDLGLVELDSVDAVQEEDFGPRFPEWAWRLTIEETAIENMYLLRADILHGRRESYEEDFDYDNAETVHTLYAMRPTPQPVDLAADFGLNETQAEEVGTKLSGLGEGFDIGSFDPAILAKLPFEELIVVLPTLLQTFGVPLSEIEKMLPPGFALEDLKKLGLLEDEEGQDESAEEGVKDPLGIEEKDPGSDE